MTLTEAYGLTNTRTTESCAAGRVPWPVLGLVADVAKCVGSLLQLRGISLDGNSWFRMTARGSWFAWNRSRMAM